MRVRRPSVPLYRNARVLSILAQALFALCMIGAGWLLLATMFGNLRQQGLPISFSFLRQAAGFAISEGPAFDPSQSYLTAFAVGVANTLRVAAAGVLLATFLGLVVGLARLSKNWLLARLGAVYVETFRNVPLLLWLVFAYAVLREALPRLRQSLSLLHGTLLMSNRGIALSRPRLAATGQALLPWFIVALGIGLVVWLWLRYRGQRPRGESSPGAFSYGIAAGLGVAFVGFLVTWAVVRLPAEAALDRQASVAYLDLNQNAMRDEHEPPLAGIRVTLYGADGNVAVLTREDGGFALPRAASATDRMVMSAAMPLFWSKPRVQGFNYQGGIVSSPEFTALLAGLVLYTAAFIAEVVRAGVQAVSKSQHEAAKALGLSDFQTFRLIILPQALRVMIPPLINQYLNLTKNSSLAIAVGYPDLFSVGLTINNQTGQAIPLVIMIMVTYLGMSLLTSLVLNLCNRRLALKT